MPDNHHGAELKYCQYNSKEIQIFIIIVNILTVW